MSHWSTARFSEWGLEFAFVPAFFVIALISAFVLVQQIRKHRPVETGLWKRYHCLSLTRVLFFPMAVAIGVFYAKPAEYFNAAGHVNDFALSWLPTLFFGSLATAAFWVWRMNGFRWGAASLMTLLELPIVGALFVGIMSVTGDWL